MKISFAAALIQRNKLQKPYLFPDSIPILGMPMALHTYTPSGGAVLSGGQRQRLLLARALVAQPSILILDEATNAMDNTTQKNFLQSQRELHMTRIVVAHRLANLRDADFIFVLDGGALVEQGTFTELAKQGGMFARMLERQQF